MGEAKNKGEWSEIYVFARLFQTGVLHLADWNLHQLPEEKLRVLSLWRGDSNLSETFLPLSVDAQQEPSASWLEEQLTHFLSEISRGEGSFESPAGERIMRAFGLTQVKAASAAKVDLYAELAGLEGVRSKTLGFSVKSRLGSPSSLLNASEHTKFEYRFAAPATGVSPIDLLRLSDLPLSKRAVWLRDRAFELVSARCTSGIFEGNLNLVDSSLATILPKLVLHAYQNDKKELPELITDFAQKTGMSATLLATVMKRFLFDVALGMVPGSIWDGKMRAYGGYIVVQPDGQLLAFHLDNSDVFREFLYTHVKLDTPSTGRLQIGELGQEDGEFVFKLALQLRFRY